MKTQDFTEMIPDYVLGKLSPSQLEAFNNHLEQNPEANQQLEEWSVVKSGLNSFYSEPSEQMDATFSDFLHETITKEEKSKTSWVDSLFGKQTSLTSMKMAGLVGFASFALLIGFLAGQFWGSNSKDKTNTQLAEIQIEEIRHENQEVRTQLVMSLADQPSASKRLQAVSEATKLNNATEQVILALFKMLNTDSNVNVRLAAITSLSKYIKNPKVREGLVMSITKQDSPLVQIALAELMVTLQEQKSVKSLEQLLRQPDINATVKQKLEESINQII